MRAANHPEVIAAARNGDGFKHRKTLIFAAIVAGALVVLVIAARYWIGTQRDIALCEKIDRFIVAVEQGVRTDPGLSVSEKAQRIQFYEDFRNDPPTCRTTGP